MVEISVVIITRNEQHNIVDCIRSARLVTDDVIVVDSGSEDSTTLLARAEQATVVSIDWKGYGHSRNTGARHAKYNWILSLDADERVSPALAASIHQLNFSHTHYLYQFRRDNYIGDKKIRFGAHGFDKVIRIYNRHQASWDLTVVHEGLEGHCTKKRIRGTVLHHSIRNTEDYKEKSIYYARLSAEKYLSEGKRAGLIKRFLSPAFNAVKSYVFQLGFLDGRTGFELARTIGHYTWLKYEYLRQLNRQQYHPTKLGTLQPMKQVKTAS